MQETYFKLLQISDDKELEEQFVGSGKDCYVLQEGDDTIVEFDNSSMTAVDLNCFAYFGEFGSMECLRFFGVEVQAYKCTEGKYFVRCADEIAFL